MTTLKSQQGFAHIILMALVVVAICGVGFYVFNRSNAVKTHSSTIATNTTTKKITQPGIVQSVVFATSVDARGAPVQPAQVFDANVPQILAVMSLKNAKTTQRLEYTRYLNGKFVDNGSIPVPKDNAQYASITFGLKPNKTHPSGTYTLKTYSNGVFEQSAQYTIR